MNTSYLPLIFALIILVSASFTPGINHQTNSVELTAAQNKTIPDEHLNDSLIAVSLKIEQTETTTDNNNVLSPVLENLKNSSVVSLPPINTYPLRDWAIPEPKIDVAAALIKDLDSGYIFWDKNSSQRRPIASLTKLMTAVVALENFDTSKETTVSKNAISAAGGGEILKADTLYQIDYLLKLMLLKSSNDAATALAETYFSPEEFVKAMQKKSEEIGMNQTNFLDSTGLSVANQSTIKDLTLLVKFIFEDHPEIFKITALKNYRDIKNINEFAGQFDFLGGKTGFIDESGGNLISVFRYRSGKSDFPILIIVLGSKDRFNDTQILLDWVKEAYSFK